MRKCEIERKNAKFSVSISDLHQGVSENYASSTTVELHSQLMYTSASFLYNNNCIESSNSNFKEKRSSKKSIRTIDSSFLAGFATLFAEPSVPLGFQRLYPRANTELVYTPRSGLSRSGCGSCAGRGGGGWLGSGGGCRCVIGGC